jgi:chorismate synthase
MLSISTCNNIITICAETQIKLVDSLNNEEKQQIIDKIKKEIDSINNIIQCITNYIMLIS